MLSTSLSLLQRACRSEPAAWERLCLIYGPIVYGWCRRAGLQDSDACDCSQNVFQAVFKQLAQFQRHGGVFHAWLWTITTNQIRLHFRQQKGRPGLLDAAQLQQWPVSNTDSAQEVDCARQLVIRRVLELVQGDFTEQTWHIFTRTTLQSESYQYVANSLGLSENAVRQARFRVIRRLREELRGLV